MHLKTCFKDHLKKKKTNFGKLWMYKKQLYNFRVVQFVSIVTECGERLHKNVETQSKAFEQLKQFVKGFTLKRVKLGTRHLRFFFNRAVFSVKNNYSKERGELTNNYQELYKSLVIAKNCMSKVQKPLQTSEKTKQPQEKKIFFFFKWTD